MKKALPIICTLLVLGIMVLLQIYFLGHHRYPSEELTEVSDVLPVEEKKEEKTPEPVKEEPVQEVKVPLKEKSEEEKDLKQVYRMLDFDRRLILNVGQQDPEICSIFCLAYGRAIMERDYEANPYDYYDGEGAVWRLAGFEDIALSDPLDTVLKRAYDEISEGRPVIFFVSDTYAYTASEHPAARSGWQHYVLLIGYKKEADYNDLKPSDFYGADPTAGYGSGDENDIPWVVLTDEAPEKTSGEYALYAYRENERHLKVIDAYADTVRWNADASEEIHPEYKTDPVSQ